MDEIDRRALGILSCNARVSWAELAQELGLSAPAVAERVRRLEELNVIRGYAALVDAEAVGCALTAMIAVTLEKPTHRAGFQRWVRATEAVQECHHVAGDDDYLLKVRCASTGDLESLLSDGLKALPGIARTRTTVVLSTLKETAAIPLRARRSR
jgi:Lrp/AsnC family leucine-responsive transcriptional regulator